MKFDQGTTNVMRTILKFEDRLPAGLYPMYINQFDGGPSSGTVTLGARGDSFYEYLAKQWVLTNRTEEWLQSAYEKTSNGIITKLMRQMDGTHAMIAEAHDTGGNSLELKMDHLVCFVVGMLQIAKHGPTEARDDKAAGDIARTCHRIYTSNPTGLGVEIVRFSENNGKYDMFPSQGAFHYIMRPEVIEAMFYQTRFHPEEYKTWSDMAWVMYEAMEKHLRVEDGWTGLHDATRLDSGRTEKMESFFVAETLKYAFLAAADKDVAPTQLPLSEWVFNTEAHPLRIMSGPMFIARFFD
jgi:mannosyl-oligosaccharide alpha-1,2-mannosidase